MTFSKVYCISFPVLIIVIEWKNTEVNTEILFNKNTFVIAFLLDNPFPYVSNATIYLVQVNSETRFLSCIASEFTY